MRTMTTELPLIVLALLLATLLSTVSASATPVEEIETLCVNRVTGVVSDGTDGCSRYELEVEVDEAAPLTLCVNRVTGVHYLPPYGCSSGTTAVRVYGDGSYDVCVYQLNDWLYPYRGDCGRYAEHKTI